MLDPLNIMLIAAAAIIFWRLKSVLGTRTGFEKPGFDPVVIKNKPETHATEKPLLELAADEDEKAQPIWQGFAAEGSSTADGLEAIAALAPSFSPQTFIEGSKLAYEMVLEAFSKGDKAALKPLLSKEVFDSFSSVIDQRNKLGHTATLQFVGVKSAKLTSARLMVKQARIGVAFVGEMISATTDKEGQVIEGDATHIRDVQDDWIFEKDMSQRDPNWKLVDTSGEGP